MFDAPVGMRRTSRLQKLYDGPYGDVLEGRVRAREETVQVSVHAAVGLIPNVVECGIVIRCRAAVYSRHISECLYATDTEVLLTLRRQVTERGGAVSLYF